MPLGGGDAEPVVRGAATAPAPYLRGQIGRDRALCARRRSCRFEPDRSFDEAEPDRAAAARPDGRPRPRTAARRRRRAIPSGGEPMARKRRGAGRRLARPRQARRADLGPGGGRGPADHRRGQGRPWRHARPAGDRRAADRARRGDQDRALCHGRGQDAIASPCAGARRATPTTPRARSCATSPVRPDGRGDPGRPARLPRDRSSRCRRPIRPSRSMASAPTTWPARRPAVESGAAPGPDRPARAGRHVRTPTTRPSRSIAARAPICAAWPATSPSALGTVGHVAALRRTAVGPFTEARAISLASSGASRAYAAASGLPASGRDRAGRHPGAGPDRNRGGPPAARPAGRIRSVRRSGAHRQFAEAARWFAPRPAASSWRSPSIEAAIVRPVRVLNL